MTRFRSLWLGIAVVSAVGCVGIIGDSDGGGDGSGAGAPVPEPAFAPGEATLHRLTSVQLGNAYLHVFGEPLLLPDDLPADDQLYGFTSISAANVTISPIDVERYEAAAYAVIDQVWADSARRDALIGCELTAVDDDCGRAFLADFGLRAWRRPLSADEIEQLVALGGQVGTDLGESDPHLAMRFVLAGVLQSPHFLFRIEQGEADEASGYLRYTDYEMASRLSFLITAAPPDDELLDAAAAGLLTDVDEVEAQARRLLATDAARPALVAFFRDFMGISRLDALDKNVELFPAFSATLGPSMRGEIERMFEGVVFESGGDFRQLFTTRDTYLNEELARVYGVAGVTGEELVPVTLPDDGRRGGLLTTPGFLSMNAHKTATSPTHRGHFVRISLLCEDVPPPPPGVDTTLPAVEPGAPAQTLRQKLEKHREDPACVACHAKMDPIGFGLEHYDALGAWRESDNGLPIDAVTELDGTPFEGGVALGELIAELPAVGDCIARRFYQHATGHLDADHEAEAVDALVESFVAGDYEFQELVIQLVVNDGFRYASPPSETVADGTEEQP